jgi:tetratricopeptide (TPR) repeat protein
MALVYLARDLKHDRPVALKVLSPELAAHIGSERFLHEIQVAAHLQHPHILTLLDSGSFELNPEIPGLYYVMPYAKDESLRERIARETQLPLGEALRITREVASALDYAHREGVVHRDIKPGNILLSDGHALVTDFGIARAIHSSASERLTDAGIALGTPAYMSPEQASGERGVDAKSDIYSLGCVLYEMLVGEPPFTGPTPQAITARRLTEAVPHIRTVRENVPERVERAIRKALAKVPADRFATAGEMAEALGPPRATSGAAMAGPKRRAKPSRRLSTRFRTHLMLLLVLVAGALAITWAIRRPSSAPGTPLSAARVVVLPFATHGGEQSGQLSGAIVTLLSSALDGVGELRMVAPSAVLAAVGAGTVRPLDQKQEHAIAARLGAARYVSGSVVEGADGHVTISASVNDLRSGLLSERITVEGSEPGQVFRLVNELAVQLLGAFGIQQTPPRLESISTGSVVALNEYLRGESALRRGDYALAVSAFGRAVDADSLFALAWFRQSYALIFTENPEGAERPLRRALALPGRLSMRDHRLAEAFSAAINVEPQRADRLYRALVYEYPDDVEAWFGHADVMLHFGPLYGLTMDSLSYAFERVLFLDPAHPEARVHLPWAAGLDLRLGLIDSSTRALTADSSGYYTPVFRIFRAFALRDSAAERTTIAGFPKMDDLQRLLAVNMTATLQDPARTERLALRLFTDSGRLPEVQAFGHVMAAHLELARGRARAALRELDAAEVLDPAAALEGRSLLALHPLGEIPDSTVRRVLARLEHWDAAGAAPSISANPWLVPHDSLHQQIRAYLLGALKARLGDSAGTRRQAGELLRLDTTMTQGVVGRALGHEILAYTQARSGRAGEALAELDQSSLRGPQAQVWRRAYSSPFMSQGLARYLRAGILSDLGREREALVWYRSLWMANAFDLALLAPAHLRQAEIEERAGHHQNALLHYRAFEALWKDADPELQWRVDRVSARIAKLAQ